MGRSRARVIGWLQSIDPAAIRGMQALRAAGAASSTWIVLHFAVSVEPARASASVVLYGVAVCGVSSLVIVDPSRGGRLRSIGVAAVVVASVTALAASMEGVAALGTACLLGLMFASFVMRRWGLRAGELTLLATMSWYFARNLGVSWSSLGWYLLAGAVAMACLVGWQFVVVPFHPDDDLERAVRAFVRRCSEGTVDVRTRWTGEVRSTGMPPSVRRVERTRGVIERQFPGVLAPRGWSTTRVAELQLALLGAEAGVSQMLRATEQSVVAVPSTVADDTTALLDGLAAWLVSQDEPTRRVLERTVEAHRGRVDAISELARTNATGAAPPAWVGPVVQQTRAAHRTRRGIETALDVCAEARLESARPPVGGLPAPRHAPAGTPVGAGLAIHPTTALAIQAVVAAGAAMLFANLLNMPHPNWVFWSAFVVIAGSAGESLRRVVFRVIGTVVGTTAGVALIVIAPVNVVVSVVAASAAIFLAVFLAPVSYVGLVLWLNFAVVVVCAGLDGPTGNLIVQRPVAAALGAGIAALVAMFVLPVRIGARYRRTLGVVAASVGDAARAWVGVSLGENERTEAVVAVRAVRTAQSDADALLPSVVFENNPLLQARGRRSGGGVRTAALVAALDDLVAAVDTPSTSTDADRSTLVGPLRDRVCDGLATTARVLAGESGTVNGSLLDLIGTTSAAHLGAAARGDLTWSLVQLHAVEVEFADALGIAIHPRIRPPRRQKGSA